MQNFQSMDCEISVIDCANSVFFFSLMDDSGS